MTMQKHLGYMASVLAAGYLLTQCSLPVAQAAPQKGKKRQVSVRSTRSSRGPALVSSASGIEKSLLGVRILQSYRNVLNLYGAPTRVYKLGEPIEFIYATDAQGRETGGVRGLADATTTQAGGAPTGGGAAAMSGSGALMPPGMGARGPGGMPMGGAGMAGMPMGGAGMAGMMSGMMGARGPGGVPGMGMPPGMGGGGTSPMGGMMGARGPGGMPMSGAAMAGMMAGGGMTPPGMGGGMAGMMGAGGAAANQPQEDTFETAGGYYWVYLYRALEMAYLFGFNKDGRLEIVAQFGRLGGGATSRSVRLGDPISRVYQAYGWPDAMEKTEQRTIMYYNTKYHVQFDIVNNKVAAIAVMLRETTRLRPTGNRGGAGGAGGGMAGALAGAGGGKLGGGGGLGKGGEGDI
jgi:hypothetical protein